MLGAFETTARHRLNCVDNKALAAKLIANRRNLFVARPTQQIGERLCRS